MDFTGRFRLADFTHSRLQVVETDSADSLSDAGCAICRLTVLAV